ncbi:MAG: sterol desaturase family protein [Flavobacteriia bacterium]|nr:sterol desaturase family protein [Flavobacteriia bacterium]
MSAASIAIYTIVLLICTNLFGLIYSILVLYTSAFQKFSIQKKPYVKGLFSKRMPLYLFNITLLLTISGFGAYFFADFFIQDFSIGTIIFQVVVAFVIDDIFFYFYHRWLHENKYMLKTVHSIHHRATKPFPLEYLYAHPIEWLLGMIGAFLGFAILFMFMPVNLYAFWIFGGLRNLHEIHIHSDLELPVSSKIPLLSKTKHHDDHHAKLTGNYSSTFLWMDRLFKTNF